jgi:hypothetical protein
LQELGVSNSSYSLRNQQRLNPVFYDHGKEVHMSDVEKFITKLRNERKVHQTINVFKVNIIHLITPFAEVSKFVIKKFMQVLKTHYNRDNKFT